MRYHISKSGEVKPCRAKTPESCPLGVAEAHFSSQADAQKFIDDKMAKEYGVIIKKPVRKRFELQSSANSTLMNMKSTFGLGRVYISNVTLDSEYNINEVVIDYSIPSSNQKQIQDIIREEYDGIGYVDRDKSSEKYNNYINEMKGRMLTNFNASESDKFTAEMKYDIIYKDNNSVDDAVQMVIKPTYNVDQSELEDFISDIAPYIKINGAEFMDV